MTGAAIHDIYGGEVRVVRHDEFSPHGHTMIDFLEALKDPDVPFFRYALLVGLLASVSLGIVGSYVVTRRITYIAAAISHCVLGGIGAALYLQVVVGLVWCNPMYGALVAGIAFGDHYRTGQSICSPTRRHGYKRGLGGGHWR